MSTNTKPKPAVFDDTAMRRLEALVAKKQSGVRLSNAETIEARELRNLKAKAHLAKETAAIAKARRQLEDRSSYRLGGLAVAAGLKDWPDDLLKKAFAHLAALSDSQRAALLRKDGADSAGSDSGPSAARAEG